MDPVHRKRPPLSALIPLTLGLSAGIAVFSLFRGSGLPPRLAPALAVDTIPGASWRMNWSATTLTPGALQLEGLAQLLGLLAALAFVVLGAACVNTGIALLSGAAHRRYEIALRAMLGASRRRLMRDFIADGLLLAWLGGIAGMCIGLAAAAALHRAWPAPAPAVRHGMPLIQPMILLAVLLLPLAASFLFSLAPRLRMARKGWIGDALSPETRTSPGLGASDMRNVLVIVQFALALVLFVSAGLLLRTSQPMRITSSGPVQLDRLYTAEIDASHLGDNARSTAYAALLRRLSGNPAVQAESISSRGTLLGIGTLDRISVMCGRCYFAYMLLPMLSMNAQHHAIAPGYFDTLGIKLLEGRESNGARDDEVVINATLARMGFPQDGPAIGKQIQVGGFRGHWYKVVGIVEDMPAIGLHSQSEQPTGLTSHGAEGRFPAIYLPALAHPPAVAELVFRTSADARDATSKVASVIAATGLRVTSVAPARARIERAIAPLVWFSRAFALTSLIVLFLALQGLYALMRTNVEARRTEIGLRRAVGARRSAVMLMILREAAILVAIGSSIGAIVAPNIASLIKVYFPTVHVFDASLTLTAIGALALASLIGAFGPARSAAWQDPASALQHE
jgi:putative ABC transport system permease protein